MELAEELYGKIHKRFEEILRDDPRIDGLMQKNLRREATYIEAHEYGQLIGDALREAMNVVTGEDLPGGRMDFSMANRLLGDHLRECDETMAAYCEAVQAGMNDVYGIGVKPKPPPSREETIRELVSKAAQVEEYSPEVLDSIVDFATWSLQEADQFMKTNADFLTKAGVNMLIMRTYEGPHWDPHRGKGGSLQDCKFCKERATDGWQPYMGSADTEIYRRHRGCRCMVVTKFDDKLTAAWTKKSGQDMVDLYNQESRRLRELDKMGYVERYLDKKEQNRQNEKNRKRRRRRRYSRQLDDDE